VEILDPGDRVNTSLTHATQVSTARLTAVGVISTMRPRQWLKNLLVFGAPAAAGMLLEPDVIVDATLAFIAFTLAASGTYLINDTIDAPVDRLHPTKRLRPIAAGLLPGRVAVLFGILLFGSAMLPAAMIDREGFTTILVAYIVMSVSYTLWLKRIAVVDLVVVAAGFGLRAVGGAFAIDVPLSQWFLIVSFFGALFVVAGKRFGEQKSLGTDAVRHRLTLSEYVDGYTQHVMTLSSGITLVGYGLWAHDHGFLAESWFLASLMFLVMTLLRFSLLVHTGASDDPVEIVWKDRPLRVLTLIFLALMVTGIEVS
jgi:decaprenyl-phosphate phosphoribosyltransferase